MENIIVAKKDFKSATRTKSILSLNYQTLFWLFMIGSVLGFVLEGVWMIMKAGYWESHTATIWGPFCIIYGIGTVAAYLISQLFSGKNILLQFAACFLSGALIEYFGSLFQERLFGTVSWDYSEHFMNIDGRVSLKMALIWGILGVLFMRCLFPPLKRAFKKLSGKKGALLCGAATVFMILNLAVTSVVVMRWQERLYNIPPSNDIEQTIDDIYDNEKMERTFPNVQFLDSN